MPENDLFTKVVFLLRGGFLNINFGGGVAGPRDELSGILQLYTFKGGGGSKNHRIETGRWGGGVPEQPGGGNKRIEQAGRRGWRWRKQEQNGNQNSHTQA